MPSYGNKVVCPSCDTPHIVKVGEINARRQIEFVCSACQWTVIMEHDGSNAAATPSEPRKILKLDFAKAH